MKPPPPENTSLAKTRFVDAALGEHARIGASGFDEELVSRILTETVDRPTRQPEIAMPPRDWKLWIASGIAAAALIALCAVVLTRITLDHPTQEFQLVVRYIDSYEPIVSERIASRIPPASPRVRSETDLDIDFAVDPVEFSSSIAPSHDSMSLLPTFAQSLDTAERKPPLENTFQITAARSEKNGQRYEFSGNVLVEHDRYRIEAVDATLFQTKRLVATSVEVTRLSDGAQRSGRELEFDPISGALRLDRVDPFAVPEIYAAPLPELP